MPDSDAIFPLVDRRAPLLERVRNFSNGEESQLGVTLANQIADMQDADDELRELQTTLVAEDFRGTLAERFGTQPDNINDDLVNEVAAMFGALEEEDIVKDSESEEDGEEEINFGEEE